MFHDLRAGSLPKRKSLVHMCGERYSKWLWLKLFLLLSQGELAVLFSFFLNRVTRHFGMTVYHLDYVAVC